MVYNGQAKINVADEDFMTEENVLKAMKWIKIIMMKDRI